MKNKLQGVDGKRDETQKISFFQIIFCLFEIEKKQGIHSLNACDLMKLSVKMEKLLKEIYIELQS